MITRGSFRETVEEMLELAATRLPEDVVEALRRARDGEKNEMARSQLGTILENLEVAESEGIPICQDTGIPIFFIKLGRGLEIGFSIGKTIEEAIERATREVPLRPNVVDPVTRKNSGDNTGRGHPVIHLDFVEGEEFQIDLMLKGGGSENWSRLFMLNPNASREDIVKKVVRVIDEAGGQPCPPSIVGVGLGGTADLASLLAKEALLTPIGVENRENDLADLESEITEAANELDVGPMGLGGETTVLGTNVEKAGCHTASLPLAINLNCWAARRSKSRLKGDKLEIEVPKND